MWETGAQVTGLVCMKCGREFAPDEIAYTCCDCGLEGVLDVLYDYDAIARVFSRSDLVASRDNSHWRYLPLIPVGKRGSLPALRVGWTPLYERKGLLGLGRLFIKDDSLNPTASLKDRASSVGVARAIAQGATAVAAASTGNAGSSLAGLAASEHVPCFIFVPADAPEPKVAQLLIYGATVFAVEGSYDDAFELAAQAIDCYGWYNRSCAVNPYLVEGKKTVAFEICEQLGFRAPDRVFIPVGDGCITSGVYKGFYEFARLGLIDRVPELVGVQAEGCAPMKRAFDGDCELTPCEACTIADSIASGHPRNWRKATRGIRASGGSMMTVTDDEILQAIAALGRETGVFAEPAGATAYAGLTKWVSEGRVDQDETVVVLMTGSGLKDTRSAMRAAGQPIRVGTSIRDVERALGRVERSDGRA
ncbi:MAG: threonine synthase [Candidatus Eisenbacteria bacterium]|nr:threonine synthase [Candidatus Eisenbacteria bacterium]